MAAAGRLGPHTADFGAWKVAKWSEEWLRPVTQEALEHAARVLEVPAAKLHPCTALELPDFPWAWHYEAWHHTNFGNDPSYLHVVLTARDSFAVKKIQLPETEWQPMPSGHWWRLGSHLPSSQ